MTTPCHLMKEVMKAGRIYNQRGEEM
uniref:Uncharacterized protein n=1 Tax=Lepeophtheirus salmonis TaxID=72036 RepID=A0A0K2TXB8_LEPSM